MQQEQATGRPWRVWGLAAALGLALVFVPVMRNAGYLAFLLLGLAQSLILAPAWLLRRGPRGGPWAQRAWGWGLAALLPALVLLLASALLTQGCEIERGLQMLLLGYLPGALYALGWIEALEAALPRRRWRLLVYGVSWLASLARSVLWFLEQPVYRVAHPFAGMLLAPPNETPEVWGARLGWHALEVTLAAALLLSLAGLWPERRRRGRAWWGRAALALVALLCAGALRLQGAELGHRVDRAHVEGALAARIKADGIEHLMAPEIPSDARPWLALDAAFERQRQQQMFQLKEGEMPPMRIFWFRDKKHKQALTGASRTRFARPHKGELYLSADSFPAGTLAHEMAHVSAAAFVDTPLRVPGYLGGLWYNPALVEGMAVAMAWSDAPLSSHEQTFQALEKKRAPRLKHLLSPLGFASHNLSVAYQVSGSFVRYTMDRYGAPKVARWYGGEDFEAVFGLPLDKAESQWRAWLRQSVVLRSQDVHHVESIQTRPPVVGESCGKSPLHAQLSQARAGESDDEVERILGEMQRLEGEETAAIWLSRQSYCAQRQNDRCALPQAAPMELSSKQEEQLAVLRARQRWAAGDRQGAQRLLEALPVDARNVNQVILMRVLLRDGFALEDYAVDAPRDALLVWMEKWRQTKHPVFGYLLARRLERAQRWESLRQITRELSWEDTPLPNNLQGTVLLESARLQGVAAFARRDWEEAERAFARYLELSPTQGRSSLGQTWLERTRFFRAHRDRLKADLPRL